MKNEGSFSVRKSLFVFVLATGLNTVVATDAPAGETVSLRSLLKEMIDRDRLARVPDPSYTAKEFTSHDRASVSPDQPGWFANHDFSNFLRRENHDGRKEYVMMDADGPGAIVCMFKATTDPTATVRIYLDESPTPVIEENFRYLLGGAAETEQEKHFPEKRVPPHAADERTFLGGFGTVKPPLAGVQSLGCSLFLPIPYARHCKVTYDKPGKCFYRINYRTYSPTTPVETFTLGSLKAAGAPIDQVSRTLLSPVPADDNLLKFPDRAQTLAPGAAMSASLTGAGALKMITVHLNAANEAQALRSTVLAITFDGEQTVWSPVGDFFAGGIGVHPYRDWDNAVDSDGTMRCFWVMPFGKSCKIELINTGSQPVDATLGDIRREKWNWDGRSMYFHGAWHRQYPIQTKAGDGTMDWNYLEASGQGVYVGDTLTMHNGGHRWWGEGDEKVYVNGETFPSQFGTGTEDYYGYSRGGPDSIFFQAPFNAHPQVEGDHQPGYSTITRVRALDAIPFTHHLKFDMEIWAWEAATMEYAATTYWYALPGATSNVIPNESEASRPILTNTP